MTLTLRRQTWRVWLALLSLALAVILVGSAAAMLLWHGESTLVETAPPVSLEELPVGEAYSVELMPHFQDAPPLLTGNRSLAFFAPFPVPVLLFRDDAGAVRAFYGRDPRNGCKVVWVAPERRFIDPCHGSTYTSTGEYVRGPSLHDLDQFGVSTSEAGWIAIDLEDFREGLSHR